MEIGTVLREARHRRGLTLHDIAESTKISQAALTLIERNHLSRLPGGIIARSFLRAYAKEVGLDPEPIVAAYRHDFEAEPVAEVRPRTRGSTHRTHAAARLSAALAAVSLLIYAYAVSTSPPADGSVAAERVETVLAIAEAHAAEDIPLWFELIAPPGYPTHLRLDLQPSGLCWVSARADDDRVLYRMMQPGEEATVAARGEILLRIGDAGAFGYRINGLPGRPLGRPGEAVTIRVTPGNYHFFVGTTSPSDAAVVPVPRSRRASKPDV